MEDISRDLRRQLKRPGAKSNGKRHSQWTLLFVEDRGRVVSLNHVRGIAIAVIAVLTAVIVVTAGLLFFYDRAMDRNSQLEEMLSDSEQRLIPVRNEKDVLMARLVVAEAKIEVLRSRNKRLQGEGDETEATLPGEQPRDEDARGASSRPEVDRRVVVEQLKVFYDPGAGNLETEFRLINTLGTDEAISGFIFVVLRGAEAFGGELALPAVNLISGKPADIDRGRYFNISRFNDIRFKTTVESDPVDFQHVTVFVYSRSGELMLEVDFPFHIEDAPSAP